MKINKSLLASIVVHIAIFSVSFVILIGQKSKTKISLHYNYEVDPHISRDTTLRNNLLVEPQVFEPKIKDPQNPSVDFTEQTDDFSKPIVDHKPLPIKPQQNFGSLRLTPKKPITKRTPKLPSKQVNKNNQPIKSKTPKQQNAKMTKTTKQQFEKKQTQQTASQKSTSKQQTSKQSTATNSSAQKNAKITRPKLRKKLPIDYPKMARRLRLSGKLLLRIQILKDGTVGQIEMLKGSGMRMLDQAAKKSVKRWQFVPATKNDVPVNSWIKVPIAFRL
ncbi:TonB family protein [Candidatus Uabimicrobium sp. HlEnr_7]|uniref:energy transducer TonB n=1 Tax=Candidatus Uabimicrobium helgolandensis TaxID=3095367 RepID=UPI003555E1BA